MRKVSIIVFIVFAYFTCSCNSCPKDKNINQNDTDLKKYDPEKAGAVIVESYNVTKSILLVKDPYQHRNIIGNQQLAVFKNYIYIRAGIMLHVFNKNTMEKVQDYEINLPTEYKYLQDNYPNSYYEYFAVIDNIVFLLFPDGRRPPYKTHLFYVDLNIGTPVFNDTFSMKRVNAQKIDEKTLGFEFVDGVLFYILGYDYVNDIIWFKIPDNKSSIPNVTIYYFQYDTNMNAFIAIDKKIWEDYRVSWLEKEKHMKVDNRISLFGSSICGNESWNLYYYPNPRSYLGGVGQEPFVTMLDKRNMDDLTNSIAIVDVEYLDILSIAHSIVYDPPYVWILVDKDDKIQMLKLLPNE